MTINPTPTVIWQTPAKRKPRVIPSLEVKADVFTPYTVTALIITDPATGLAQDTNVAGFSYGETGLGYYPNPDPANSNLFIPVHLPTGIPLSNAAMPQDKCQAYLRELAAKLNWHGVDEAGPPASMMPDLVTLGKKFSGQ